MAVLSQAQQRAWDDGERATVALVGQINLAVAGLVGTIRMLLDTDGWAGVGIASVEHWVQWKAALSARRARDLVRIARRIEELPACWALFQAGRLSEDAMVRIARRVPAERDEEVAGWAPGMTISQLTRALRSCPELPDPTDDDRPRPEPEPQRYLRTRSAPDGWGQGEFSLPPDEMAQLTTALQAARDAEFRDRQGLELDDPLDDVPEHTRRAAVSWADALVRLASEGSDALDSDLARSGHRGERHKVVLHVDVEPDGSFGPAQLHGGPIIPDPLARYLRCDAEVLVAAYQAGRLIGINPLERTVNRATRRVLERRDQGCAHPLCSQARWLHIHHIIHWEHNGPTIPSNLVCLCRTHHRQVHTGELSVQGNPEDGTLVFLDAQGRRIEPPDLGSPELPEPGGPSPYTPPYGERLDPRWFGWN